MAMRSLVFVLILNVLLFNCSNEKAKKLEEVNKSLLKKIANLSQENEKLKKTNKNLQGKIEVLKNSITDSLCENPSTALRLKPDDIPKVIKKVPLDNGWLPHARIEGSVILEVENDIYGNVRKVLVISGHPILNKFAVKAVLQLKFEPYIKDGCPIPVSFIYKVNYRYEPN